MKPADILKKYYGKTIERIVGETKSASSGVTWERMTIVFSDGTNLSINSFAVGALESALSIFEFPENDGDEFKLSDISKSVSDHIKAAQ